MERNLPKIALLCDTCCGCGACVAKCAKGCIEMLPDEHGFLRPSVDSVACTGCGVCDTVCPGLCSLQKDDLQSVIWAKSLDSKERFVSSSGGVFALLAHEILATEGVVCGVAWEPGCKGVHHVLVKTEDELDVVMRSKYVQSMFSRDSYEGIRSALMEDRRVLFAGTACQVAGLRAYLGKLANSNKFLAVDIVCHGVPSPQLWKKWAEWREARAGASLRDVNMRSKTTGWLSYSAVYLYVAEKDNASVSDGSVFGDDWYFKAFLNNASLRSSCYGCRAKRACGSDITLGDFWGIQTAHPEVNYEGGVSAVLCNTAKGANAVEAVKEGLEWGGSSLEKVLSGNPSLMKSVTPYAQRDGFMSDLARGVCIDEMIAKYDFKPMFSQRVRGKLGGVKRRVLKLLGRA